MCCYFIVALITDASNRVRLTDLGLSTENQKANGKLETKNTAVVNKKENKQEKKLQYNTVLCSTILNFFQYSKSLFSLPRTLSRG